MSGSKRSGSRKYAETAAFKKLVKARFEEYIAQQLDAKPQVTIDGLVDGFMKQPLLAAKLGDYTLDQLLKGETHTRHV